MICILKAFMVAVWNFELYMLPVALLLVFVKNLVIVHVTGNLLKEKEVDVSQPVTGSRYVLINLASSASFIFKKKLIKCVPCVYMDSF